MKIAIIGGHLSPALAVIDQIPKDVGVVFFGRKYTFEGDSAVSLEYKIITEREITFIPVTTGRLQRSFTKHTIPSLAKMPVGYFSCLQKLRKEKVQCVVSFGGYLSIPVCLAAKTLGIPIVVHEQTMGAGFANKIIGKFADRICISWESSRKFFANDKIVFTGNPMRLYQSIDGKYPILKNNSKPLIYITGGSSGSHFINVLIEKVLPQLLDKYRVLHQTGDAKQYDDFQRLTNFKENLSVEAKKNYEVHKFIIPGSIESILTQSSVVISRSGVNTVTELLYFGTPSILIPLSTGQQNEQYTNASFLEKLKMAEILEQKNATPENLLDRVERIIHNSSYKEHGVLGRSYIQPDASNKIVSVILNVATKKTT